MANPSTLKAIRLTHLYTGVFLAPAILFFAITGGLQTFSLHETTRGSAYVPPAFLVHLSQLHKKATLTVPEHKQPPASAAKPAGPAAPPAEKPAARQPEPPQPSHLPMKIFFAIVALGLVVSTLSGLYMAWKYTRNKLIVAGLFLAGILLPLLLLPF